MQSVNVRYLGCLTRAKSSFEKPDYIRVWYALDYFGKMLEHKHLRWCEVNADSFEQKFDRGKENLHYHVSKSDFWKSIKSQACAHCTPWPLGAKYVFMGSEAGGKLASITYALTETIKINNVNPEGWNA